MGSIARDAGLRALSRSGMGFNQGLLASRRVSTDRCTWRAAKRGRNAGIARTAASSGRYVGWAPPTLPDRERTAMLRHQLIHPKINEVLGRAGHHAKVLIADGNYAASSKKGPNAEVVCLNLMPGVVTCTQVLHAVLSA